jgi:hypothetical protein
MAVICLVCNGETGGLELCTAGKSVLSASTHIIVIENRSVSVNLEFLVLRESNPTGHVVLAKQLCQMYDRDQSILLERSIVWVPNLVFCLRTPFIYSPRSWFLTVEEQRRPRLARHDGYRNCCASLRTPVTIRESEEQTELLLVIRPGHLSLVG